MNLTQPQLNSIKRQRNRTQDAAPQAEESLILSIIK